MDCAYRTEAGETHYAATKRQCAGLERDYSALSDLLWMIVSKNDHDAALVLHRLRDGESVQDVLNQLTGSREGMLGNNESTSVNARQRVLLLLAQSTANLQYIINFLGTSDSSAGFGVKLRLDTLRNRIVNPETLVHLATGSDGLTRSLHFGGTDDTPTFVVPASPWTNLTTDDLFVSHLLSVFINYVNPYWRYVEEDLVLQGMRAGKTGTYCSPLLVNAICAFACVRRNFTSRSLIKF